MGAPYIPFAGRFRCRESIEEEVVFAHENTLELVLEHETDLLVILTSRGDVSILHFDEEHHRFRSLKRLASCAP
eukprot:gene27830-34372_t